jgi:hypothetical protein
MIWIYNEKLFQIWNTRTNNKIKKTNRNIVVSFLIYIHLSKVNIKTIWLVYYYL